MPRTAASRTTTISLHARTISEALFRYGALTREQLAQATGLTEYTTAQHLKVLVRNKWVAIARDHALWQERSTRTPQSGNGRPKSAYYLDKEGVAVGGAELGEEYEPAVSRAYKRIKLPRQVAHRVGANDFLLALRDRARHLGLDFPEDSIGCESALWLPMFSGAWAPKRAGGLPAYRPLEPDGVFELGVAHGEHPFLVEYETHLRTKAVVDRFEKYVSRWRRRLAPEVYEGRFHEPSALVEPIVLVAEREQDAAVLKDRLAERLPSADGYDAALAAFRAAASRTGTPDERPDVTPLHMVLVTDMVSALGDPVGQVYKPLAEYPSEYGGSPVDLLDAAHMAAILVPAPEAPAPEPDTKKGGR